MLAHLLRRFGQQEQTGKAVWLRPVLQPAVTAAALQQHCSTPIHTPPLPLLPALVLHIHISIPTPLTCQSALLLSSTLTFFFFSTSARKASRPEAAWAAAAAFCFSAALAASLLSLSTWRATCSEGRHAGGAHVRGGCKEALRCAEVKKWRGAEVDVSGAGAGCSH
jgi:hypothetical protein